MQIRHNKKKLKALCSISIKVVTGYFKNVKTYKNDEAKLKSLLFGDTGQLRTQKAFQLCESFAKAEIMEFYN